MDAIVVRRARPAELADAAEVAVAAFLADGPLSHDQRLLADAVAAGEVDEVYVAMTPDGSIAGTACLLPSKSEHSHVAELGERELRLLAVAPNQRGNGIGEILLRGCAWHAAAEGADELVLSAQPTRLAARKLYERLGFERLTTREWHRDGIDLLVYGLALVAACGHCGLSVEEGTHDDCRRRLAMEPPRFCTLCARRMVVQVTPAGWTARCVEHGTVGS
ncbi:MAG: acetyltransferase [Frankiales bacterium]|nr:acetyltransferase [Frankiales bacterium]